MISGGNYGPTPLPLVAPTAGAAVADPLLTTLLSFFKAVGNAYAPAAWSSVAAGSPVVQGTFAHDPEQEDFNTRTLPGLFLWRTDDASQRIQLASDYRYAAGALALCWVTPLAGSQAVSSLRDPFAHGLFDVFDACLEQQIDPAWKFPGDSYPSADSVAANGSVLFHLLPNIKRLYFGKGGRRMVSIPTAGGTSIARYSAWQAVLNVEERLTPGISTDTGSGLQASVNIGPTTPGGDDGYPIAPRTVP